MKSIFHLHVFATDIDRHLSPRYELLMVIRISLILSENL
jgi:hypothetical protein